MNQYQTQTESALRHPIFRHYTTFEALASILQNKKLRLSALRLMNDPVEEKRTDKLFRNKYFVIGFSHELIESIPMWRMYGRERQGVCLEFTSLDFANDNPQIVFDNAEDANGWEKRKIQPIDVVYAKDLSNFTYPEDPLGIGESVEKPLCAGYAKSELWKYESETRIIAYIDVKKGNSSRIWGNMSSKNQDGDNTYAYPISMYIYISLSNEILSRMIVRFNPFMSREQKSMMRGGIESICPELPEENIQNSKLEGKIILR